MAAPGATLAPFRNVMFRRIWAANVTSQMGQFFQTVAAGWLMATITTSDSMVALVHASNVLPIMFFALPAGAMADMFDRRRIMICMQVFMAAVSFMLAISAHAGILTPWGLLTFTFLIGVGQSINSPAWQASTGDIVARPDLPQAVSLNSMGFNLTRSVAPAIGGFIVSLFGVTVAFAANAVSYFPLILTLFRWHPAARANVQREPLHTAIVSGLRHAAGSSGILKVLLRALIFGITAVALTSLLPLISRDLLGGQARTYGLMLGCFGFGGVLGALLNARLRTMLSHETIVRMAFFCLSAMIVTIAESRFLVLSCAAIMTGGMCWILCLSLFNTTTQLAAPRWVVGRALSLYQTALFGGMAVGSWIWGNVSEFYGVQWALWMSGIAVMAGGLVGLRYGMPPPEERV